MTKKHGNNNNIQHNKQRGKVLKYAYLLLICLTVVGCQAKPKPIDPAIQLIHEDTKGIKKELKKLNRIRHAELGSQGLSLYSYNKPKKGPLTKKISLEWSGDAEKALRKIAKKIKFKFEVTGRKPINLNHIIISSKKQPAIEVIEDIGWQAGSRLGVLTNNNKKIIKVIYAEQPTQWSH